MTSGVRRLIFLGLAGAGMDSADIVQNSRTFGCALRFIGPAAADLSAVRTLRRKPCRLLAGLDRNNPKDAGRFFRSFGLRAAFEQCRPAFLCERARKTLALRWGADAGIRVNGGLARRHLAGNRKPA